MVNKEEWGRLRDEFNSKGVTLVAVSKFKPASDIRELYDLGQRDFGENYVQESEGKHSELPADIRWHFIGHLQSNKVKYIAPFVHLIHTVDSFKLLAEINKQAQKNNRTIDVLLQMYIANEETKFGMDEKEIIVLLDYYEAQKEQMQNVRICGLMGMATNTDDAEQIKAEFCKLHNFFVFLKDTTFFAKEYFSVCSMGMSSDYKQAIEQGSNMVRIGSLLFGARN
jgi:PLP dependent protein